jgi:hypothetical protein
MHSLFLAITPQARVLHLHAVFSKAAKMMNCGILLARPSHKQNDFTHRRADHPLKAIADRSL